MPRNSKLRYVVFESEIGGKEASAEPNREIGFGFVSCSCRACVRAKLCGCVREVLLNAGGSNGKKVNSGAGFVPGPFAAIRVGFKDYCQLLVDSAWVLRNII